MLHIPSYEYLNRVEERATEGKKPAVFLAWSKIYLNTFNDLRNNCFFEMEDGKPLMEKFMGASVEVKGELIRHFGKSLVYVNASGEVNQSINTFAAVYAVRKGDAPVPIPVEDAFAVYITGIAGFPSCAMLELLDHIERHNPAFAKDTVPKEQVYRIRLMQDMPEDVVAAFRTSLQAIPLLCPWAKAVLVTADEPYLSKPEQPASTGGGEGRV